METPTAPLIISQERQRVNPDLRITASGLVHTAEPMCRARMLLGLRQRGTYRKNQHI
jgi:hypothetical protein